eukprot:15442716-Alexandrium_andersonii.AAC.1
MRSRTQCVLQHGAFPSARSRTLEWTRKLSRGQLRSGEKSGATAGAHETAISLLPRESGIWR